MTTARERMKVLSGLSGLHSARAHFLAITQGTGTGVDRLVFASQMTVCMSEPRIIVTQRVTKRDAPAQRAQTAAPKATKQGRDVSVLTAPNRLELILTPADIYVQTLRHESFVIHKVANMEITR